MTSPTTSSQTLTQRQTEVLQVIRNHIESTGAPPTRAEIAKTLGFRSVNAAEDHLKALARKGAIVLSPGTSRGIQLSEKHGLGLPIVTRIQSDKPLLSEDNITGRLRIQNEHFTPKPDFMLKMQGASLTGSGIKDGDLLAIHSSDMPNNNQIVVAKVNGKLEVRRYFSEGDQISLKADNPDYPTITVNRFQSDLKIEGIAVGIIRSQGL